jgi:hypothetical protein
MLKFRKRSRQNADLAQRSAGGAEEVSPGREDVRENYLSLSNSVIPSSVNEDALSSASE